MREKATERETEQEGGLEQEGDRAGGSPATELRLEPVTRSHCNFIQSVRLEFEIQILQTISCSTEDVM